MVGVDELQEAGRGFLGKLGLRQEINSAHAWFASLQTMPKMPTLSARYWVSASYNGNPSLKPEQVTFLQTGHEYNTDYRSGRLRATHMIRAEKRSQVQLIKEDFSRDENSGSASLLSMQSDHGFEIDRTLHFNQNLVWTYSVLEKNQRGYPSLARFNDRLNLSYQPGDAWQMDFYTQLVGDSTTAGNKRHPGYVLHDIVITHRLKSLKSLFGVSELALTAGLENIFDVRAEPVFLYPLPGRMIQTGLSAKF
jgi:outer membrane receptor protein involved in Fe transport